MSKTILYPNSNGSVVFVWPAPDTAFSVEQIAQKDVPEGVPYIIANTADLPSDHAFFEAFEADFSNPDGTGIGADAWFAAKAAAEAAAEAERLAAEEAAAEQTVAAAAEEVTE
jgi:hypothetical protein